MADFATSGSDTGTQPQTLDTLLASTPSPKIFGNYCDPTDPAYDPLLCGLFSGGGGGGTTTTSSGTGDVSVDVTNNINVVTQIGQELADAIYKALTDSANSASQIAQDTSNQIADTLNKSSNAITTGINSAFGSIGDFFKAVIQFVSDNIGKIFDFLKNNISSIISDVANGIKTAVVAVVNNASTLLSNISDTYNNYFVPIINLIQQSTQTIAALTTAIERDLTNGLSGILQIPSDIANGLGSLDASLNRTVQQIGEANKQTISETLGGTANDTIWNRLQDMGGSLNIGSDTSIRSATFSDHVKLPEPDLTAAGAASIDAIWSEVHTLVTNLLSGGQKSIDSLKTALAAVPFFLGDIAELPAILSVLAASLVAGALPLFKFLYENISSKAGLSKLQANDALQAWLRQFIDDPTLAAELGVNGWDAQRIQVMKDLLQFQPDAATAIDWFYRQIIDDASVKDALTKLGYDPDQQTAAIAASKQVFNVAVMSKAWQWGIASDDDLYKVLSINRWQQEDATNYVVTLLKEESPPDIIMRLRYQELKASGLLTTDLFDVFPQEIIKAARRDGNGESLAADSWLTQFQMPGIAHWMQSYFRGIRTSHELDLAFQYFRVPPEWRQDFIAVSRPLIPFRTIPTMLKAGVITEANAKLLLQQHGYDLPSVEALISYAQRNTAAAATAQAVKTHTESVAVAQELHALGAIDDKAYSAVLAAHGFDQGAIDAELQLQTLKSQVAHRKEVTADIVGNALLGNITYDQAQQQLQAQNLSPGEISKALRQIRTTRTSQSKLPTIAELVAMVKNKIITEDDFKTTLGQIGYAQKWVDAFDTLHFAPAQPTTGG